MGHIVPKNEVNNTAGFVAAKIQNDQKIFVTRENETSIYQVMAEKVARGLPDKVLKSDLDRIFDYVHEKLNKDGVLYHDEDEKELFNKKLAKRVLKNSKLPISKQALEEISNVCIAKHDIEKELQLTYK